MLNNTVPGLEALRADISDLSAKMYDARADLGGLNFEQARNYVGADLFDSLTSVVARKSALASVEAISTFVLEVLFPFPVGEGEADFLGSVADEVEGGGELANFRALRRVLEAGRDAGSGGEVADGVGDGFSLASGHGSPWDGSTFSVDAPSVGEAK